MTLSKKRVAILIAAICVAYFFLFAIPNARGAESETMLARTSVDEPVNYPYVVRMLTPAKDLKDLWSRWIIYGDYHYGYPFYFLSAVSVLPVRLIHGANFVDFTPLNLWLLRQLISVLPLIAAMVLLIYMQTRFETPWWATFGLLLVLFTNRSIVRGNIQWWHPDALSILAVVVTFFFLARDRLRFGRNFYIAAAACGVAAGIKLAGFFFFLAIPVYLLAGLVKKILTLKKMLVAGGLFVLVMAAALVVTNPFLYNAGARQEMVSIQTYKTVQLDQGYDPTDPAYSKGPAYWAWTLGTWFGQPFLLGFLVLSLLVGCIWGPNRLLNNLILVWCIPFTIYLLYFVAVKPDYYWLPVMLPLFSAALNIPLALKDRLIPWLSTRRRLSTALIALILVVLAGHVVYNVVRPYSGNVARYTLGLNVEN
jgi:hypothetical protein